MKGLLLIVAGGALVVGLLGSVALAAGNGMRPDSDPNVTREDLRGVNFIEHCDFSHAASDDPIVFPGKAGASHRHSFVGNRSTDASSTHASLRAAPTSCERAADTAAYWAPSLYQGTNLIEPEGATIYYRRHTLAEVQTFPDNFRMIAGDATATTPQGMRVTFWNCGAKAGVPPSSTVPTCPSGKRSYLRLHIRFPSCWNGRARDSADHRSHVAYANMRRSCPSTHPVELPAITLIYRYPSLKTTPGMEPEIVLASGNQFSAHGDFFNAWKPKTLERLVDRCLNALVHCGRGR